MKPIVKRLLVKIFFHSKIYFMCLRHRLIFFLLHRHECFEDEKKTRRKTKEKQRNEVSDIFISWDMENMWLVSRM